MLSSASPARPLTGRVTQQANPRADLPYPVLSETGNDEVAGATRHLFRIIEANLGEKDPETIEVFDLFNIPAISQVFFQAFALQAQAQDPRALPSSVFSSISAQQAWQHLSWRLNGRRVYDISPTLSASLLQTSLARLSGGDVPIPVPSFYLRVADSDKLGLTVWNAQTGEHKLDGFYVSARGGRLFVLATGLPHEGAQKGDDALCTYTIDLTVPDLEEATENFLTLNEQKLEQNTNRAHEWLRVILGFCLYLACEDADVEKRRLGPTDAVRARAKKLGGKAGKRLLEQATLPVHYLRVGYREKQSEELENVAGASDEIKKLTKRFIVRGHFRQQAHGPGRTMRKTIFVRSFWKGPPWGELAASITRVRSTTEE